MQLIKLKEAAKLLGLSEKTLYQWHWRKADFPFVKLGRTLRVSEEDLFKYIKDRLPR